MDNPELQEGIEEFIKEYTIDGEKSIKEFKIDEIGTK